jgi:hypothetical protein
VALQITALEPEYRVAPEAVAGGVTWTHALISPRPEPSASVVTLLGLLGDVISLPELEFVDFAMALDWYKIPEEGVDPRLWANTPDAELVREGKYLNPYNAELQAKAGLALVERLCGVISRHTVLQRCTVVLDIPGHDASRVSFGSRLAHTVAIRHGWPFIKVRSRLPFRPPAKNREPSNQVHITPEQLIVPDQVNGHAALIVDDVFRTGQSMRAVGAAARRLGAGKIFGLCCVRTMRA